MAPLLRLRLDLRFVRSVQQNGIRSNPERCQVDSAGLHTQRASMAARVALRHSGPAEDVRLRQSLLRRQTNRFGEARFASAHSSIARDVNDLDERLAGAY